MSLDINELFGKEASAELIFDDVVVEEDKGSLKVDEDTNEDIDTDTPPPQIEGDDKKTEVPPVKIDKEVTDKNQSLYSSLNKALSEEGFFSLEGEEEDVEDFDTFKDKFDKELDVRTETRIKELLPDEQFWVNKKNLGYSNDEVYSQLQGNKYFESLTDEVLTGETEEAENIRKDLITALYKDKGFSDKKIARDLEAIFEKGTDIEEAQEAKEILEGSYKERQKLADKAKQEALKAQQENNKKTLADLKEYTIKTREIIPGNTLTKKEKDSIYKGLIEPKTLEDGRQVNIIGEYLNKFSIEDSFKLAYILKTTDGLKNLDGLSAKKARSKAVKEFETAARSQDTKDTQYSGLSDMDIFGDGKIELIV